MLPLWRSVFALVELLSLKSVILEIVRLLYFCYNSQMKKRENMIFSKDEGDSHKQMERSGNGWRSIGYCKATS